MSLTHPGRHRRPVRRHRRATRPTSSSRATPARGVDGAPVYGSRRGRRGRHGADRHRWPRRQGARRRPRDRDRARSTGRRSTASTPTAASTGWMTGSALVPRDSAAPRVWEVDDGTGAFSPNGDGSQDTLHGLRPPVRVRPTGRCAIVDGGGDELARAERRPATRRRMTWAPAAGSGRRRHVPLGRSRPTDGWGNGPLAADGAVVVDTARARRRRSPTPTRRRSRCSRPTATAPATRSASPSARASRAGDRDGPRRRRRQVVDRVSAAVGASARHRHLGRPQRGRRVRRGRPLHDRVRGRGPGRQPQRRRRRGRRRSTARWASSRRSQAVFFPQDGDSLARTITLSFRLALRRPRCPGRRERGRRRRAHDQDRRGPRGRHATPFAWDGRNDAGAHRAARHLPDASSAPRTAPAPRPRRRPCVADAFRIVVSDATPGRGQRITVTATSAEALDGRAAAARLPAGHRAPGA